MKQLPLFFVLMFVGAVSSADESIVLWYSEQEPDFDAERVRYIINDRYLRSDDGSSANGFVLLDRKQKTIFNVVPQTRSILVIDGNGEVPKLPASIVVDVKQVDDPKAPAIAGKQVREIKVSAKQQLCYSAIVVPGLYDKARQAFLEFKQVLATQQAKSIVNTPADIRTDCFMVQYLYAPARHLEHGLPVSEWNKAGTQRQLINYETVPNDSAWFELPADYRRYSPP